MRVKVTYDFQTSARAGAGGMFQIESVSDAETGKDLTRAKGIDQGMHFSDQAELEDYLRGKFDDEVTIDED